MRLTSFAGVLLAMALWELVAPRRKLTAAKPLRWASNLGLVTLNTVLVRLATPLSAVAMAALAAQRGWGLLNWIAWPKASRFHSRTRLPRAV